MNIPVVSAETLRASVSFQDLIEPVSQAFQDYSAGLAESGTIVMFPGLRPELGDVYVKTGAIRGRANFIVKISPWFAANVTQNQPQGGFMAVFDAATGQTVGLLHEEHYLSDIRTAAAGALAARLLAPRNVEVACVVGAGVQAYWQSQALFHQRPFGKLLIWARDAAKAEHLAQRLRTMLKGAAICVAQDLETAVRLADVVMATTPARSPIIRGEWLRAGQHITAVGADDPTKCELDSACYAAADIVVVDSLETTRLNGDIHRHLKNGDLSLEKITGEIGAMIAGRIPGRAADDQITIAKFVGLGVQDLVAAEVSLARLALTGNLS